MIGMLFDRLRYHLPRKRVRIPCDLPIRLSDFSFINRRSFGRLSIQYIRYHQCLSYGIAYSERSGTTKIVVSVVSNTPCHTVIVMACATGET